MGDTECGVLVVEGGVLVVDLDLERDDLLSQLSHLACLPETLKSQCPITSTGHGVSVLQSQTRSRVFKVRHGVECSKSDTESSVQSQTRSRVFKVRHGVECSKSDTESSVLPSQCPITSTG
jgi:hypothetical protein